MAMGFDREAATALERIYAAEGWRDLSDLLSRSSASATPTRPTSLPPRARVDGPPDDADQALGPLPRG